MINKEWKNNITVNEISNDVKRYDFVTNDDNWKVVFENKYPRIQYLQLRGTDVIKIIVPSNITVVSDKKVIGAYRMVNDEVITPIDRYIGGHLKSVATELRKKNE